MPEPVPAASLIRLDISQSLLYDCHASFLDDMPAVWDQLRPEPRTALVAAQLTISLSLLSSRRRSHGLDKRAVSNPLSRETWVCDTDREVPTAHRPERSARRVAHRGKPFATGWLGRNRSSYPKRRARRRLSCHNSGQQANSEKRNASASLKQNRPQTSPGPAALRLSLTDQCKDWPGRYFFFGLVQFRSM